MSQLGSYITYEYGVLRQVFSYLSSKDLNIASQVCREWKEVAFRVVRKRNKPLGYFKQKSKDWPLPFDDKPQPKVILHIQSTYGSNFLGKDFFPMVSRIYNLEDVPVYNIRNNFFMASEFVNNKLEVNFKLGKTTEATMILCNMPGVNINSIYIGPDINTEDLIEEIFEDVMDTSVPKGVILITGGGQNSSISKSYLILSVLNKFCIGKTVYMAGGVAEKAVRCEPLINERIPFSSLCISFHGDNVEVKGAVHTDENLDKFMKNFSKDVGSLSNGAIRFAFMFSCINRLEEMRVRETTAFSKHFPNVPVYGLWSFGEFAGILKGEDEGARTEGWIRTNCTSYLMVTLKRAI